MGGSRISRKGFICRKVWGFALQILAIFIKYPIKTKLFGLTETKLFHFHWIYKNRGGEGGSSEPPSPLWIRHWCCLTSCDLVSFRYMEKNHVMFFSVNMPHVPWKVTNIKCILLYILEPCLLLYIMCP